MERKSILTLALAMAMSACAGADRGSVAMKIDDREAHICMENDEVRTGDRVALFRNECGGHSTQARHKLRPRRFGDSVCQRIKLGEGRVVRPLNERCSVVEVDPGVEFDEGAFVEKL
jgi:hypothetical protein